MKKILLLVLISLCSLNARAEFNLGFDYEFEGWTPRYVYMPDDNLIGETHYAGVSYFKRSGSAFEGPTLRYGMGKDGGKVNIAYTDAFSFLAVDFGLSYTFLDEDNPREYEDDSDAIGIELGLRLWVVQIIAVHSDYSSYVSLGYGF
jgi:hypothetical protein